MSSSFHYAQFLFSTIGDDLLLHQPSYFKCDLSGLFCNTVSTEGVNTFWRIFSTVAHPLPLTWALFVLPNLQFVQHFYISIICAKHLFIYLFWVALDRFRAAATAQWLGLCEEACGCQLRGVRAETLPRLITPLCRQHQRLTISEQIDLLTRMIQITCDTLTSHLLI